MSQERVSVAELSYFSSQTEDPFGLILRKQFLGFFYVILTAVVHRAKILTYTVILFVSTSGTFGICTVLGLNGTLVEDKMRTF